VASTKPTTSGGASPSRSGTSHRGGLKSWNKKTWARAGIAVVVLVYVILFIVLNSKTVEIDFVFFSVRSKLWVGFLVCLVLGVLLGVAFAAYKRRGAHPTQPPAG
jgi:uncharacterized integral membrane protein